MQLPAEESAAQVLGLARSRPASLGTGRLICVDGPAGSGKTTLAAAIARLEPAAAVVHVDDLLEGWGGLPRVAATLAGLLAPLAQGRPGRYRRWDWLHDRPSRIQVLEPASLVVVEGVGSGSRATAPWTTVLAWVEVPADVRLARAMARDGERVRPQWEQWMLDEQRLFTDDGTLARADVVV